ncbi:hypothetical protein PLICRDRAFT_31067 [Plicaturopsis crispa FD-325 SS-3]|nr:hypothetical protein PLICRDRAFT_31067 [Plicaturopsis crispa FD-325 SS-3]
MADEPILLAFKAGRAFRREGTNFVDPDPAKGAIVLKKEDGLLHFIWKNRTTNVVDEDLILFPSDATFAKVTQSPGGRTYVLKFSSSNQRHFDASTARDAEFVENVNKLLLDPDDAPVWGQPTASTSQVAPQATPDQLAQLRNLVQSMSGGSAPEPELALTDIVTPANIAPLFTAHPELVPTLFPHLPPDLPTPPSPEVLQRVINSPQFRAAVRNFDQALRTGLLGNLVTGLGLPAEAGLGIEAFLRAVQEQANRGEGGSGTDSMETD